MTSEHRRSMALVVDDDAFMLRLFSRMLGTCGIATVAVASEGRQALAILGNGEPQPGLILCDLNMPGMDGLEFLRHLAEMDYRGDVVLVSGEDARILSMAKSLAEAHRLNILGTLAKPVAADRLAALLLRTGPQSAGGQESFAALLTAEEVREGIAAHRLTTFFQPKVDVRSRQLTGTEALVRWDHPRYGTVEPADFLHMVTGGADVDALTDSVVAAALANAGAWRRQGVVTRVAINISMQGAQRLELPDLIAAETKRHGLSPADVIVEVTEDQVMADAARALEVLTRLRLKGIGLSIDDFGTGYSSMEQLKRFPFTELKIDRTFIHGARTDATARAIVESSVALARRLGLSVVAEGVESEDDWNRVAAFGIDEAQGFFVAEPMPGDAVLPWLRAWES